MPAINPGFFSKMADHKVAQKVGVNTETKAKVATGAALLVLGGGGAYAYNEHKDKEA